LIVPVQQLVEDGTTGRVSESLEDIGHAVTLGK
jgi:hypothetical protein